VPDFHIDAPANAESSESNQKQLLLDDVHFKAYPDTIYSHQRKKKRKMAKMSFSLPSMASSSKEKEEQGEGVPRADQREEEGADQLMSVEQKLQFRFGYEPNRDRGLVAKLARHYFAKDKVVAHSHFFGIQGAFCRRWTSTWPSAIATSLGWTGACCWTASPGSRSRPNGLQCTWRTGWSAFGTAQFSTHSPVPAEMPSNLPCEEL
jgi:hypothetical protein